MADTIGQRRAGGGQNDSASNVALPFPKSSSSHDDSRTKKNCPPGGGTQKETLSCSQEDSGLRQDALPKQRQRANSMTAVLEWLRSTPVWPNRKRVGSSHQRQRSNSFQESSHQPLTHRKLGGHGREVNQSQMELDRTKRELEICKRALEAETTNQTTLQDQFTLMQSENAVLRKEAELDQAKLEELKRDSEAAAAEQTGHYASLHAQFTRMQSEQTALREQAALERAKLGEELGQTKRDFEAEVEKRVRDYASLQEQFTHTQSENTDLREQAKLDQADLMTKLDRTKRATRAMWSDYYNTQLSSIEGRFDAEVNARREEAEHEQADLKDELDKTRRELATTRAKQTTAYILLQEQFTLAQSDNAALRDQVKFVDDIEATHVVNELDEIHHAVEQICMNICDNTEAVLNQNISNLTADNICDWDQLKSISAPPVSLWEAAKGKSRDLIALLDDSLTVIIISYLDKFIFAIFHPCQSPENSEYTQTIYAEIRRQEPQAISGPVRANMFKAIDHVDGGHSKERLAHQFVQAIRGDWAKILSGVFGRQDVDSIFEGHLKTLEKIYLRAYDWNHKVKAHVVSLDYNIYMPAHNTPFDCRSMRCLAKGERKPGRIICAVWFGLQSSRAVGKQQPPEVVCQQKTDILSEHYFQKV